MLKALAAVADDYDDDDDDDDDDDEGGGGGRVEVSIPARPTSARLHELLEQLRSARRIGWERLPELAGVEALLEASDAAAISVPLGELISHQKVLQHTASESMSAAFAELITLSARAHATRRAPAAQAEADAAQAGGVGVRELLPLAAMLYSLVGTPALSSVSLEESEQRLRETLLQACLRDPAAGGLLAPHLPRTPPEELSGEALMARQQQLSSALGTIFERLRGFAAARRGLGGLETLLLSSGQTSGEVYRPLLRHVVERALRGEEVSEMHRPNSNSIGSLFSRGANLLGVKTRARLTDHRTIIIFVLGGISLAEVRELRQLVAQHPKHRLILGATQIASPDGVWEQLTAGLHVR